MRTNQKDDKSIFCQAQAELEIGSGEGVHRRSRSDLSAMPCQSN